MGGDFEAFECFGHLNELRGSVLGRGGREGLDLEGTIVNNLNNNNN